MTLAILNAVYAFAYVIGLAIASVSLLTRLIRYIRAGWRVPKLLWRDVLLIVGLAIPFGGGLVLGRVLGIDLADNPMWVIPTGALAAVGIWVFVYNELFVIERPPR